jgi:hypothetical protein
MRIGYALSSEQFGPDELVDQAKRAQQAGFAGLSISDHFHPWNEAQGNSPFVTMEPDPIELYRNAGGSGTVQTGTKACFDADERRAVEIAHRLWGVELNPGELNRELPTPGMISEASSLISPGRVAEQFPCGPDPDRHIEALHKLADGGFDEAHVQQIGPDMDGFFDLYATKVLPALQAA